MKQISDPNQYGFTLIEIIGVLAIMSIMAATIAPSAIQMLTAGKQTAEDKALTGISDALRLYVQTNKKIPKETTWASDLATLLNTAPLKVSSNGNNGQRIYLYPDDFIASANTLAYNQATAVAAGTQPTITPKNPRVLIVSNLNPSVTLAQPIAALTAATFKTIWDQNGQAAQYTEGDMLKISRINLANMFHHITLQNYDTANTATYYIDSVPLTIPIAPSSSTPSLKEIYLINTTLVDLYANGTIYNRYTIQNSMNAPTYSYNSNVWGTTGDPYTTPTPGGGIGSTSASPLGNLVNSSGMLTQSALKAKSNCNRTASAGLIVDSKTNAQDDYFVYEGDSNGNIIAWDKSNQGDITFFGNTKPNPYTMPSNGKNITKQRKQGKQGGNKYNDIQTCDVILVVPSNNPKTNISFFIFYMPEAQTTTPYEVTIP